MLLKMISHKPSSPTTEREDRLINGFISAVKNCPAADVRPVAHGRWKNIIQGIIPSGQCSNCGAWDKVTRFCPNCGADMREES